MSRATFFSPQDMLLRRKSSWFSVVLFHCFVVFLLFFSRVRLGYGGQCSVRSPSYFCLSLQHDRDIPPGYNNHTRRKQPPQKTQSCRCRWPCPRALPCDSLLRVNNNAAVTRFCETRMSRGFQNCSVIGGEFLLACDWLRFDAIRDWLKAGLFLAMHPCKTKLTSAFLYVHKYI